MNKENEYFRKGGGLIPENCIVFFFIQLPLDIFCSSLHMNITHHPVTVSLLTPPLVLTAVRSWNI